MKNDSFEENWMECYSRISPNPHWILELKYKKKKFFQISCRVLKIFVTVSPKFYLLKQFVFDEVYFMQVLVDAIHSDSSHFVIFQK